MPDVIRDGLEHQMPSRDARRQVINVTLLSAKAKFPRKLGKRH